jgi:hypothetical protein
MTNRKLLLIVLVVVSALAAACGGESAQNVTTSASDPASGASGPAPTRPRPAALADLPLVELVAPGATNAGRAPTFRWGTVAGAAAYRLTVLGSDAPRWSWQGNASEVRYGGVPEGVDGPSLVAGSWWSVAALDESGALVALSELRAVSPASDPGLEPSWAGGPVATAAAPTVAPTTAATACAIVSTAEITAAIQGDWGEPKDESLGAGDLSCAWTSSHGTLLTLSVEPAGNYDPEGWGADEKINGLGSTAYGANHGWDRRIGWVHDDVSVTLLIDFTKVDKAGYLALAHVVDERLP